MQADVGADREMGSNLDITLNKSSRGFRRGYSSLRKTSDISMDAFIAEFGKID